MSFEIILGIVGVALTVPGLIPVFADPSQKRKAVIQILAVGVLCIFSYQIIDGWKKTRELTKTREEIIQTLAKKGALPFDELFQESYLFNYDLTSEAIDSLFDDHQIRPEWVEMSDKVGNLHRIRLFGLSDGPRK
jgi:hypothetical protein